MLSIPGLHSNITLGLHQESLVLLLGLLLLLSCPAFDLGKIRHNHLKQTHNTAVSALHPSVRLREGLGGPDILARLRQDRSLAGLSVELTQDLQSLVGRNLALLGLRNRDSVLLLFIVTLGLRFLHCLVDSSHVRLQITGLTPQLRDCCLQLINVGVQFVQSISLGVTGLLVGTQLSVAPALMLGLLLCLLLQLSHHITDHLLHVGEDILRASLSQLCQNLTLQFVRSCRQHCDDLSLQG
mmetsp:Transcript_33470/g.80836  ORF Transcript_33470/g.80836 Transcript_33470/m.80836 type:complete len:240 (+) Transcript_33470:291-1010(+)